MFAYKVLPAGDTALIVEFGDGIDRKLSAFVLALARRLDEVRLEGIVETVPTFRSLMVHYDPLSVAADGLIRRIANVMEELRAFDHGGREWHLPVCYDPELAPDLREVAERTGLTVAQVVERHCAVTYHVYMLGFMPGLAYMGDLPAELVLVRRDSPRLKIPAGSLGIAMAISCIFPAESPCGLHLIGRSPVPLWRQGTTSGAGPSTLLAPGDKVVHKPISIREYLDLSAQAAAGMLDLVPVNTLTNVAA